MNHEGLIEKVREVGSVSHACDLLDLDTEDTKAEIREDPVLASSVRVALAEHKEAILRDLRGKKPDWYAERRWPGEFSKSSMKEFDEGPDGDTPRTWKQVLALASRDVTPE